MTAPVSSDGIRPMTHLESYSLNSFNLRISMVDCERPLEERRSLSLFRLSFLFCLVKCGLGLYCSKLEGNEQAFLRYIHYGDEIRLQVVISP